mgnify:CR=1 FL=1
MYGFSCILVSSVSTLGQSIYRSCLPAVPLSGDSGELRVGHVELNLVSKGGKGTSFSPFALFPSAHTLERCAYSFFFSTLSTH